MIDGVEFEFSYCEKAISDAIDDENVFALKFAAEKFSPQLVKAVTAYIKLVMHSKGENEEEGEESEQKEEAN